MVSPLLSPAPERPDRSQEIGLFLAGAGWGDATRGHLAGDASFRRYERVVGPKGQAVLMDAPPPWEDVRPFIQVTHRLQTQGLSAPEIYAADEVQGFLLLEDLGDASFTRILRQSPQEERTLYEAAVAALVPLQEKGAVQGEGLPPYDDAVYMRELLLFTDWFLPQVVGRARALEAREAYMALWQGLLRNAAFKQQVLVHRDYHADNLLWLPERQGVARVGMLDYQDALLGDPYYDLASLLQDARRDVATEVAEACLKQFMADTGEPDPSAALARYALLAAQRNLKIVGIFTRLCVRDGKPQYLSYLPRVWGHLMRDMENALLRPSLAPLKAFIDAWVPMESRGVIAVDSSLGSLA